jgi:hypothetical protein
MEARGKDSALLLSPFAVASSASNSAPRVPTVIVKKKIHILQRKILHPPSVARERTTPRRDHRENCVPVQCSAVQCSAVQCSAVQCSAVQCSSTGYCENENDTIPTVQGKNKKPMTHHYVVQAALPQTGYGTGEKRRAQRSQRNTRVICTSVEV